MKTQPFYKSIVVNIFLMILIAFSFCESAQAQTTPLTLAEIFTGLESKGSETTSAQKNEAMTKRVKEQGVSFRLNDDIKRELKNAGASDELIDAIKNPSRKKSGASTAASLKQGSRYYKNKQYDEAIAQYTTAITLDPNLADAYYQRGLARFYKDQYDEAIADYTKAMELNPKLRDAYISRGSAYYERGLYDEAIKDFNKLIELYPKFAYGYVSRGLAYYYKNQYDSAVADFRKALSINSKYKEAKKFLQLTLAKSEVKDERGGNEKQHESRNISGTWKTNAEQILQIKDKGNKIEVVNLTSPEVYTNAQWLGDVLFGVIQAEEGVYGRDLYYFLKLNESGRLLFYYLNYSSAEGNEERAKKIEERLKKEPNFIFTRMD